ncbi:MAG TPA: hypothetical protein VLT89_06500 [Usitatibacter sp.]|nr:hypothetical protein [Usitatibacter sp.]
MTPSPARAAREAEAETQPGRACPASYRYSPRVFRRAPQIVADTVYVIGGLYGNVEALEAIDAMAGAEERRPTLVFNGDFHWFDVAAGDFEAISKGVAAHPALRGNVETEIAIGHEGAGCGCAYPLDVSDAEVSRSNEIIARLRRTALDVPERAAQLAALPMTLVARIGGARAGIVHGDATSLAGWGFAHDRLDDPRHRRWIDSVFCEAQVDLFASSHTCLPALRAFTVDGAPRVVANNGAAGMPNFARRREGIVTRIGTRPYAGRRVAGMQVAGVHVELIEVGYDADRWNARFLSSWPPGSPAHDSYWRRMAGGPRHTVERAAR